MKKIRNLLTVTTLLIVLMVSTSIAKAGLLVSDLIDNAPPSCAEKTDSKLDWGIVITGFTGIVITGFTGIVITGAAETQVDCGILMSD